MKKLLFLLCVLCLSSLTSAQTVTLRSDKKDFIRDGIATDTIRSGKYGQFYYNEQNGNIFIQFGTKSKGMEYTPDSIYTVDLRSKDKKLVFRYVSRSIEIDGIQRKAFLQQLTFNNRPIFEYRHQGKSSFYYEDNNQVFYIEPERSMLEELTKDNPHMADIAHNMPIKESYIREFFLTYDKNKALRLPSFNWGVTLGGVASSLTGMDKIQHHTFDNEFDYNLNVGIFADIPIYFKNLYFHPEIQFSQNTFSIDSKYHTNDYAVLMASYKYLSGYTLIRYISPTTQWRPYGEGGLFGSYLFGRKFGDVYTFNYDGTLNGEPAWGLYSKENLNANYRIGFALGAGCIYQLSYKRAISFGVRYSRSFGDEHLGNSIISANFSYHF